MHTYATRHMRRRGWARIYENESPWLTFSRILESIKAGKRLPEARFATLKIAPQAQASVYGLFSGRDAAGPRNGA